MYYNFNIVVDVAIAIIVTVIGIVSILSLLYGVDKSRKRNMVLELLKTLPDNVPISSVMFETMFSGKISSFSVTYNAAEETFQSEEIVLLDGKKGIYAEYSANGTMVNIHYNGKFIKIPSSALELSKEHCSPEAAELARECDVYMRADQYPAFQKFYYGLPL